jgi:hypothetical protein
MKMSIKDFEDLQQSFEQELKKAEAQENSPRIRFQKLSRICRNVLIKLSNGLHENPFPDKDTEIYFFKRIKAEIMARYIFYQKVHWFHTGYFKGSAILERKRLEKERCNIERFFWENQVYYAYYRNDCTHHDDVYFVRGQHDEKICPPVNHFDTHFSTSFDGMLAEMMARELMLEYVEERLKPACTAVEAASTGTASAPASPALTWTGQKTDLVEIAYAMVARRDFGGTAINQVMAGFEIAFGVDLGDYYNSFNYLKNRKKPTKCLDELKANLLLYIERMDD